MIIMMDVSDNWGLLVRLLLWLHHEEPNSFYRLIQCLESPQRKLKLAPSQSFIVY